MNAAILGGDLRSRYLAERLHKDGHGAAVFGLEKTDLAESFHRPDLLSALKGADCVVLPTPAAQGDLLHTPLACSCTRLEELVAVLSPNVPVFAGGISPKLRLLLHRRAIPYTDLLDNEAAAIQNAALTAQCALLLMLQHYPYPLMGTAVLILGAGRIGKLLGLRLQALGARVTVSARKAEDLAWCAAMGFETADTAKLSAVLPHCPIIVNTVPAMVLSEADLSLPPPNALLLELASLPGGFDTQAADRAGLHTVMGRGLPGKLTPAAAGDIIAETIYAEMEL